MGANCRVSSKNRFSILHFRNLVLARKAAKVTIKALKIAVAKNRDKR